MEIVKAVILMLVLGAVIGFALGIASKKLAVEEDHRVEEVYAMLPGYNCGGCGNPGCMGMAMQLVEGTSTIDQCKPCKADAKAKIREYLEQNKK